MSSRDRLVDAAIDLIEEFHEGRADPREVFGYLTPRAVAERAGVSRALIYHHWSDDDSYRSFLTEVADRIWVESLNPDDRAALAADMPTNLSELILGMTALELHRATVANRGNWRASQALVLYGLVSPASMGEPVMARAEFYGHLADRLGYEPIPPLTYEQIGVAIGALVEGFTLLDNSLGDRLWQEFDWEPRVPTERASQWNLLAVSVEGIVSNMVRPVRPPVEERSPQVGPAGDEPRKAK